MIFFPALLCAWLTSCQIPQKSLPFPESKQPISSKPKPKSKTPSPQVAQKKAAEVTAKPKSKSKSTPPTPTATKSTPQAQPEPLTRPAPELTPNDPVDLGPRMPPAADKPITVKNNNATRIIEAKGEDVNIEGDDGLILITGGCRILTIKGKNNQIQSDSVEEVIIEGNQNNVVTGKLGGGRIVGDNNTLKWQSGMIAGLNPIVQTNGVNNETKVSEKRD